MTECQKARAWRERHGLSRKDLADLTGYSYEAIKWFEAGMAPRRTWSGTNKETPERPLTDAPNGAYSWQRYKNCCAAVEQQIKTGEKFAW